MTETRTLSKKARSNRAALIALAIVSALAITPSVVTALSPDTSPAITHSLGADAPAQTAAATAQNNAG